MLRSGVVPPQKPRPKGANRATSEEWKRNIRKALKDRGMTYRELGALCGNVSSGGISQMLAPAPRGKSTRIMVEVHAALGLPPPDDDSGAADEPDDPNFSRLMTAWGDLDEGKRGLLVQIAENFARGT